MLSEHQRHDFLMGTWLLECYFLERRVWLGMCVASMLAGQIPFAHDLLGIYQPESLHTWTSSVIYKRNNLSMLQNESQKYYILRQDTTVSNLGLQNKHTFWSIFFDHLYSLNWSKIILLLDKTITLKTRKKVHTIRSGPQSFSATALKESFIACNIPNP